MNCIYCGSEHTRKSGNYKGMQKYLCVDCKKTFNCGEYESNFIMYFNSKIKKCDTNKLTRDNYCIPTNKVSTAVQREMERVLEKYKGEVKVSSDVFKDKEHYTDEFVKKHYERCMKNFDLNMKYFNSLDSNDFNKTLNSFVTKHKFVETKDLNELNNVSGVYILVLDEYKQVYIGTSENIKKRIISHWNNRKDFTRLIWGDVNTSILSIDSFGAFDTTRIFYKKLGYYELFNCEERYVDKYKSKYLINRVAGGINDEDSRFRDIQLMATRKTRKME